MQVLRSVVMGTSPERGPLFKNVHWPHPDQSLRAMATRRVAKNTLVLGQGLTFRKLLSRRSPCESRCNTGSRQAARLQRSASPGGSSQSELLPGWP